MSVVLDTNVVLMLLDPSAGPPLDPSTGKPVDAGRDRIEYLVKQLSASGNSAIIPTPVLAEVLTKAGAAGATYVSIIDGSTTLRIEPFDKRAAVELGALESSMWAAPKGNPTYPRQKVKVDRQIVAIAKVHGASTIYSDDEHIEKLCKSLGIAVIGLAQLPKPPPPPAPPPAPPPPAPKEKDLVDLAQEAVATDGAEEPAKPAQAPTVSLVGTATAPAPAQQPSVPAAPTETPSEGDGDGGHGTGGKK